MQSGALAVISLLGLASAQDRNSSDSSTQPNQYEKKLYVQQNGTQELTQTLESEHHVISNGEVQIQRFRAPAWAGDDRVTWEREVRTVRLPDGSTETQDILRNPDGSGTLVPVQITHEKAVAAGDSTVVQRTTLQPVGTPDLQPVQKEQIILKGSKTTRQAVSEIQRPDSSHQWQTVEKQSTLTHIKRDGDTIQTETNSVRQTPGIYGSLADFERRHERTVSDGKTETREQTVFQRDNSTLGSDRFFMVDHTVELSTFAPGTTIRKVVRESEQNVYFDGRAVEEKTSVQKRSPDGSSQSVTRVSGSGPDPSVVSPTFTIIESTDAKGYVRQISIPED